MAQSKQVKTDLRSFRWEGGRTITIHQKIVEGPTAMLGKHLALTLTFEEINNLREHMAEAVKRLEQTDARLAKINADNS